MMAGSTSADKGQKAGGWGTEPQVNQLHWPTFGVSPQPRVTGFDSSVSTEGQCESSISQEELIIFTLSPSVQATPGDVPS